jgi:hypothetical protein
MTFVIQKNNCFEPVQFSSEEEFESLVTQYSSQVFWSWIDTGCPVFINKKQFLTSKAGVGTIPDGYLLWLDDNCNTSSLYFVEFELSSHSPYDHIVPQLIRFQKSLTHHKTREAILDFFLRGVEKQFKSARFRQHYKGISAHKFITSLLDQKPGIIVVIDKATSELKETVETVKQIVKSTYILEVNILVNNKCKSSIKPHSKVWGRYPVPDDVDFPEWYSAVVRKRAGNKYLVKWCDGDVNNTKIDCVVPFEDYIITVNDVQ